MRMDQAGQYLEVASDAAKSTFGQDARVSIEECSRSFPEHCRWMACVKQRGEIVVVKRAGRPAEAVRHLAEELVDAATQRSEADRALLSRASQLGL